MAVIAHLCDAALRIDRVALEVLGETVIGELCLPDSDGELVAYEPRRSIVPHLPLPRCIPPRTPVTALYGSGKERFRFVSEVVEVGALGTWQLRVPSKVRASGQRYAVRQVCSGEWKVRLDTGQARRPRFRVRDISASGLSLAVDLTLVPLSIGQAIRARLVGPESTQLDVELRVQRFTHSRTREHVVLAGCSFTGLDVDPVRRIAAVLGGWPELVE